MLTRKYFDGWLKELEAHYQVLSFPTISIFDAFCGNSHWQNYAAMSILMDEINRIKSLRRELDEKGLLISDL